LIEQIWINFRKNSFIKVLWFCSIRIPIWYELKLLFIAWLALPNFRGAAFIYNRFVREQLRKHGLAGAGAGAAASVGKKDKSSPSSSPKDKEKTKSKFLSFVTPKKDHEAYWAKKCWSVGSLKIVF
jgi:hypothetical protein